MVYLRCALGKPVHRATMYNDIRLVSYWHPGCVEPIFRAKLDCHLSGEPVLECSLVSTSLTPHEMTRKVSLCKGEKGWGQTWCRRIMCNFRWILRCMTAPKIKKLWKRTKKTWKHTICPFAGNFPSMLAPPVKHLKKPWFTAPPPQHFTGCRQHQCAAQHGLRGAALGKVVKTPPNVNQNWQVNSKLQRFFVETALLKEMISGWKGQLKEEDGKNDANQSTSSVIKPLDGF